jgi:hypothetical protein
VSRLDEIKARADAATKGPWLQDGPWWTDDGGPEPTALPCVVDVDRALVVFPPDATDVGMKRPEDRAANMAFIAAAREDVPWLIERVRELIGAICWDTTCLNCSSLLDSNYDQYMRAEIAEAEVERLTDLCDEFRKREESQDCIRERLTAEVERLERWKFEATEVMSGLRELGKALGLGLGVQITGPAALAEVERLTAEREWFKDRFPCDGVCVDAPEEACSRHGRNPADLWRIIGEVTAERDAQTKRAERLERWYADALTMLDKSRRWKSIASLTAERDSLAARLALVEALAEAEVERLTAERDALAAQVARLAKPGDSDARMDAYYYGFTRTGVGLVDDILSAVAKAGKSYHGTDMWNEELSEGGTCESRIQDAADAAAEQIRAALSDTDADTDADTTDTQPTDQEEQ